MDDERVYHYGEMDGDGVCLWVCGKGAISIDLARGFIEPVHIIRWHQKNILEPSRPSATLLLFMLLNVLATFPAIQVLHTRLQVYSVPRST